MWLVELFYLDEVLTQGFQLVGTPPLNATHATSENEVTLFKHVWHCVDVPIIVYKQRERCCDDNQDSGILESEWLVLQPAGDQVKRRLWLVKRHHMTGVMDVHEGDVASAVASATRRAHRARKHASVLSHPRERLRADELLVELGRKLRHPTLVALSIDMSATARQICKATHNVVAHGIGVAGVDEKANTIVNEVRKERAAVVHAIALEHKCLVDLYDL